MNQLKVMLEKEEKPTGPRELFYNYETKMVFFSMVGRVQKWSEMPFEPSQWVGSTHWTIEDNIL